MNKLITCKNCDFQWEDGLIPEEELTNYEKAGFCSEDCYHTYWSTGCQL